MRPLLWKRAICTFLFIFFVDFNSKGFNRKRDSYVLRFLEYLGATEKKSKQKASEVLTSISLEQPNNALFGKEIAVGLCLATSATLLANKDMLNVYLSVYYWNFYLNRCTRTSYGFHFLLVKCVLKCGVDHTQRRTSASLN